MNKMNKKNKMNNTKKKLIFWLIMTILMILVAIFAGVITTHNPELANLDRKLEAPSISYPLGTDHMGRCILCRIIFGARVSLLVAGVVVLSTVILGTMVGLISGYYGGIVDNVLMRIVDTFLAFPSFLFTLAFVGICGGGMVNLIIAQSIFGWMYYARVVRGEVLGMKEKEFIKATRGMGVGNGYIIFRHVLPNIMGPVIVIATMNVGGIILATSGLSFLGIGIQPPTPEWGYMINDGKMFLSTHPGVMLYPGITIILSIITFNFLGDTMKDTMDVQSSSYLKER